MMVEAFQEIWARGVEQLVNRPEGPLSFRLIIMPIVVSLIAIRAGIKNGRAGKGGFLWAVLFTEKEERRLLFRSAVKDIGRIFIVAIVLDTIYQFMVLKAFYIFQAVIIAIACAVVPYVLIRGPVTLLTRLIVRPPPV